MKHIAFPSIEAFYQVKKHVAAYPELAPNVLAYRAKVKLDGTNACVQVTSEGIFSQSRTAMITVNNDNVGFAAWVEKNKEAFSKLFCGSDFYIFGEWCGPGIQKGFAVQKIPNKVFAVFMIQCPSKDNSDSIVITDPAEIVAMLESLPMDDIIVLPWYGEEFNINWINPDPVVIENANKEVAAVEQRDPFIFDMFSVEGAGEGLVYYPVSITSRKQLDSLLFKAKGDKSKVVATKQAIQINPEVAKSIEAFVNLFVTPGRLEQGFNEVCKGDADSKLTGQFIGWVAKDVEKESKIELAESGLNWDQVQKGIVASARSWYLNKVKGM